VVTKRREPDFEYKQNHMIMITDDFISSLMYNTLTIGVYGMIESKKNSILIPGGSSVNSSFTKGGPTEADETNRLKALEK